MALAWRRRKPGSKNSKLAKSVELSIPSHFRCPISLELMRDPVTAATGITYDRQSIEAWLGMGNNVCPVTNRDIRNEELVPNHSIRKMIQDWCVANRSFGIERIPTPKIPLTNAQAEDIVAEIAAATRRGDAARCEQLVANVKKWAKESERNRLCILSNGSSAALASAFCAFAGAQRSPRGSATYRVPEEILAALTMFLPLDDDDAASFVRSPESLCCLASVLKQGDLSARLNAALLARELLASGGGARAGAMADAEGLVEALAKLVKEPISSRGTKASLVSLFYLVNRDEGAARRAIGTGLVPALVEALVDAERSMCEKALAVLDGLLSYEDGREAALEHALTVPVLIKKMFRVSDMATEFAVSALWKVCRRQEGGGEETRRCSTEALQGGAFQKLLLLLQVGCSEATKEKATNLLKELNAYRERFECVDTVDFKGVKKPLSVSNG
ncbi:U-box domain-containing protein 21-like [Canna indica]|uniref:U-box domain-containing protein n=1 Tax=Canna indica TaxID=4628 RepID=A0AAQ3JZ09_9LILI|nr:U-box domain-containing protein 21-like [Canna indica]